MPRLFARARTYRFDELPARVQDRFVASVEGRFPPRPTLHVQCDTSPPRVAVPWALGAVVGMIGVLALGFGDVGRAHQPHWVVVPLAALVVLALVGRRRAHGPTPFADGWYVFPTTVVQASGGALRKFPIEDLTLRREGPRVVASLGLGASFSIDTFDPPSARALLRALTAPPPRPSLVFGLEGHAALHDPLADADDKGVARRWTGLLPSLPRLAFAAIVATTVHGVRDRASDELAFAHARAIDDPATWQAYLADGRYGAAVRDQFLPRAELRVALAAGSLSALSRYASAHPTFGVADVRAARRRLLLEELGQASSSLEALVAFELRHPGHGLDAEVRRVRRSIYRDAVVQVSHSPWQGALAATPPKLSRLLYAAEAHGPRVAVRFVAEPTPDLGAADAAVTASARFAGTAFLPSHQLDHSRSVGAKSGLPALRTSMRDWLGELVDLVPDTAGDGAPALVLDVVHSVVAEGLLDGPGPALPALTFHFRLVLRAPSTAPETLAEVSVPVDKECVDAASAKSPEKAYAAMARWAFRELGPRLLDTATSPKPAHDCAS